jgi:hypothetical protein
VTSFDVNKAIQRSLTKAVARHGLGLYIYAGEDLPEDETPVKEEPKGGYGYKESIQGLKNLDEIAATANYCAQCGTLIRDGKKKSGAVWAAVDIASYTKSKFGRCLCQSCASDASKQEN